LRRKGDNNIGLFGGWAARIRFANSNSTRQAYPNCACNSSFQAPNTSSSPSISAKGAFAFPNKPESGFFENFGNVRGVRSYSLMPGNFCRPNMEDRGRTGDWMPQHRWLHCTFLELSTPKGPFPHL
jgi:hypothetical protein